MHRAWILFLLLAGVAPMASAVTDPGASDPIRSDVSLQAVALSRDPAWLLLGASDPGSVTSGDPDEDVWFLFDPEGLERRTGDADSQDCGFTTEPSIPPTIPNILDPCTAGVVEVALSADGRQLAIGAVDAGSDTSRIWFATRDQGRFHVEELEGQLTRLRMTPDGTHVAAGLRVDGLAGSTGAVHRFAWNGVTAASPGTVTPEWDEATSDPVTALSMDDRGRVVAAAGSEHVRFSGTGVAFVDDDVGGSVASVAFSAASLQEWSVAGYDDGGIGIYSSSSDAASSNPAIDFRSSDSRHGAVAMSDDGARILIGDTAGTLRLMRNRLLEPAGATLIDTESGLDGAVRDIAWSKDGRYAAVAAGTQVVFFRVDNGLRPYWSYDMGAAVTQVAISGDGDRAAALAGGTVRAFDAIYAAIAQAPERIDALPGTGAVAAFKYTNAGNREATISLDVQTPGWAGAATPASFTLAPAQSQDVRVNLTVPSGQPAGAAQMLVRHTLQDGSTGDTRFTVDVAAVTHWDLQIHNAPSQDIQPGQSVTYRFSVRNAGNAPDTATVQADVEPSSWRAAIDAPSVDLAAGAQHAFNVTLTAPSGAVNLETGRVTVYLDADPGRRIIATGTVGARFGLNAVARLVGTATATPDAPATVEVTLRNTGNGPDAFRVEAAPIPNGWSITGPSGQPAHQVFGIEPGGRAIMPFQVVPAASAQAGNYRLTFTASSLGDPSQASALDVVVAVPETAIDDTKDGPFIGAPLLLVAIAAIAAVKRRR